MNINYSSVLQEHQLTAIRIFSTGPADFDKKAACFLRFAQYFDFNVALTLANTSFIMKPTINTDAAKGVVRNWRDPNGNKICAYFRTVESSDQVATVATRRRDELDFNIPEHTFTFTIEQAKQRGLFQKNRSYKTMPEVMLVKRATMGLIREVYPEIFGCVYAPDELAECSNDLSVDDVKRITEEQENLS